jgi:glycosyltransferase involved in cell wall biosynthesis
MTGTWSLRKGSDVLVDAWRELTGVKLLHVGPLGDAPLPTDPGFEHVDAVPQSALPAYYAKADVFALASREEGLALVQVQALASGLPIVCTARSGGEDLKQWLSTPDTIQVVPPDDVAAFSGALRLALDRRASPGTLRDPLGPARRELSWRAYAERYERRIVEELESRRR